ncbi:MAG: uroporphyrinogen-III synthase [Bacteroidota bacterium]
MHDRPQIVCLKEPSERIEAWANELGMDLSFQPVIFIRKSLNEERVKAIMDANEPLIFTSSNALKQVRPYFRKMDRSVYCVGQTAYKELSNVYSEVISANSAKELVEKIDLNHVSSLTQFVGNLSLKVIEEFAEQKGLSYRKEQVYETQLINPIVDGLDAIDALLFFSPSGVRSFLEHNELPNCLIGAMGKTTAKEIPRENVIIPEQANTYELLKVIRTKYDNLASV